MAFQIMSIAYCIVSYYYTKKDYYGYHDEDIPEGAIDFYVVSRVQYIPHLPARLSLIAFFPSCNTSAQSYTTLFSA